MTVLSDSLVNFEGGAVSVERGGVRLVTSNSMLARAGSVATPGCTGLMTLLGEPASSKPKTIAPAAPALAATTIKAIALFDLAAGAAPESLFLA